MAAENARTAESGTTERQRPNKHADVRRHRTDGRGETRNLLLFGFVRVSPCSVRGRPRVFSAVDVQSFSRAVVPSVPAALDYAPLPKNVVAILEKRLASVKTVASR